MLTEDQAIEIAKKFGKQYEVNYEMVINDRTPEEALIYCGIEHTEFIKTDDNEKGNS